METGVNKEWKIKNFAEKSGGEIIGNHSIRWPGPEEAPQNSLTIPLFDLGRTVDGVPFRISLYPGQTNTLI